MSIEKKHVLILCQSNEPIVSGKLMNISKKVLQSDNIELEFMSNPTENPSKLTNEGKSYAVTYKMYFNISSKEFTNFIEKKKDYYSLIIMNTCPAPFSPTLSNEIILDGLKKILKEDGLLIISYLNYKNSEPSLNKKKISEDFKRKLSNIKGNIFYKYFEEINIDNNDITILYRIKNTDNILFEEELLKIDLLKEESLIIKKSIIKYSKYKVKLEFELRELEKELKELKEKIKDISFEIKSLDNEIKKLLNQGKVIKKTIEESNSKIRKLKLKKLKIDSINESSKEKFKNIIKKYKRINK